MPRRKGLIYIGADHYVKYQNVRDDDGNFLNDGTAQFWLYNEAGDEVLTASMDFVSDGYYRALIDRADSSGLTENDSYSLKIVFTGTGGEDDEQWLDLTAVKR
jgi:hypothetical protein